MMFLHHRKRELRDMYQCIAFCANAAVFVIAIIVLIGWKFDIQVFKSIFPGFIAMKVNAALSFIASAIAIFLFQKKSNSNLMHIVAKCLAGFIMLIAVLTLLENIAGYNFGIDNLIFSELSSPTVIHPGRMSAVVCIAFILISASLLLVDVKKCTWIYQAIAALVGFFGLMVIIGITFHLQKHNSTIGLYAFAAIHAAFCFILTSYAILFLRLDRGIGLLFVSKTVSGHIIRRTIPTIIVLTVLIAYLRLLGEYHHFYDTESGLSMIVVALLFVFISIFVLVSTKLKNHEEMYVELNKELTNALAMQKTVEEKMNAALRKATESNNALQQFAYIASHDLQEPLRMVSSFTELLERRYKDKLDQDAKDFIHFANDGAKRMQLLVNSLLSFSRVATQGKDFVPTDCNIIYKNVLDNLKILIEEKEVKVTADPLPTVMADEVQISQVFQNLINNAIKFCRENPTIHVSVKEATSEWIFSVKDNGIGIPKEEFNNIFIIFHRLHTREEFPGTGMGLAICKRIIERHNGKIWVNSQVGKGSTFYFSIPK